MSEDGLPDAAVVQGDVRETMQVEEKEEGERKRNEQQKDEQEKGEELQPDDELKQRVIARQEEKGKGELSAAAAEENDDKQKVAGSKLVANQQQQQEQRKRTRKNATSLTSKQKEQQPNLYNLSKQLENHTRQLSRIGSIVEQLPRYLKNVDAQSRMVKQINYSMNQLQKQVVRIQKSVQKKSK
jgi:hypothetical protein